MKFTLKNIGAPGFGSQMHWREMSALKLLTNNICVFFFCCCWCWLSLLLVDAVRVRRVNSGKASSGSTLLVSQLGCE